VPHEINQMVAVGSVLLWLGTTPDEQAPSSGDTAPPRAPARGEPTLKAAQMLAKLGLAASDVPASGDRLTVKDIEAFLANRNGSRAASAAPPENTLDVAATGTERLLTPEERGMLRTVEWHRDEAVPGYVELQYRTADWEKVAAAYQQRDHLLISPLLALMAYRLIRLASEHRAWNGTIVQREGREPRLIEYDTVNLGFTVQADRTLYLTVLKNAAALGCREFVDRLGQLQRSALAHRLQSDELTGATISFSSMARWQVTRHVPVLPPHTSLIVAHAAAADGVGTLGATYDHRVLTGFDALTAIRAMSIPEGIE
jgi:pyruvate/2-oxoglutarate dehydrogenase complex dihydrolipoamide acyltransferase (E2) component